MKTRPWLLALLSIALCRCFGGSSTGPTYDAKCEVACRPPAGPCQGQDPKQCQADCSTLTEGLSATCAQCVIDNSGWKGVSCSTTCSSCCPCAFGPVPSTCSGNPGCTCSAADETCTGYVIGKASDATCTAVCSTR